MRAYGAQMCEMRDRDASIFPSNGSDYNRFEHALDHVDEQETTSDDFNQLSVNLLTSVFVLFIAVLGGYGRQTGTQMQLVGCLSLISLVFSPVMFESSLVLIALDI